MKPMRANSSMVQRESGLWAPDQYRDKRSPALRAHMGSKAQLAGDSILVTVGSGATVATHTVGAKEHQVMMVADEFGHLLGSRDTYFYNIPSTVHIAAANSLLWDLFNADAALLVRVHGIYQLPNITTAVTGVVFDWLLERTTAAGTGGTAQTAWLPDTSQTALDADVTCRLKPTGGATQSTDLLNYSISSEETNAATQLYHMLAAGGLANLVPQQLCPPFNEHGILLRQNQGIRCVQVTNSVAGNTGWFIAITVE